jgi:hypothetical protein
MPAQWASSAKSTTRCLLTFMPRSTAVKQPAGPGKSFAVSPRYLVDILLHRSRDARMTEAITSNQAKRCIFCGTAGKLSREHIWGKWIKQFVRRDINKHHFHAQRIPRPGSPATSATHPKAGDPLSSQVRVVCVKCNNTWLSRIQDDSKLFLIPLIRGTRSVLGERGPEQSCCVVCDGDHDGGIHRC